MKPHLPVGLLAAVLASFSWTSAAESISINFGTTGSVVAGKDGTAGIEVAVASTGWNSATGQSGSKTDLVNQAGEAIGGSVVWLSPASPWGPGSNNPEGLLETIQATYLDYQASALHQWTVNITTDFLLADVYVYLSGDKDKYGAVTVNGMSYIGAERTQDEKGNWSGEGSQVVQLTDGAYNTGWGDRSTDASKTLEYNKNALRIAGINGTSIDIQNALSSGNAIRATLSGVQIVDASADLVWSRTITGETSWDEATWANTANITSENPTPKEESWNAIVEDSTARAFAELNGSGTVRLDNAVTAEAVIAASGSTITLTGEELNLNGLATLLAQSEATLTLENTVAAEGAVTIGGSGKVLLNTNQTWHGLVGAGTLEVAEGKSLTLDGAATSSFTGHLVLRDTASASLAANDFSHAIRAEGSGVLNLAIDGSGATFGNSAVWRGNAATAATASHVATVTNATVSGNLTVIDGTGSFGSVETTITNTSVTGWLYGAAGSNNVTTTNGFTLTIGENANINAFKIGAQWATITGNVTVNVTGGVIGSSNTNAEGNAFALTARDGSIDGNVALNVSGGTIAASNIVFGGYGINNGKSLTGNVTFEVSGGTVQSNIHAATSWGGHIGGDFTVLLKGGSLGVAGGTHVLSAGSAVSTGQAAQSVKGNVSYTLDGGADGYGATFLGTYSILAGGSSAANVVGGTSTVTLSNVRVRHEDNASGVANFTGVISGANADGAGVTGSKSLVFDNYRTLAQANFKHFDTATVQNASQVTLNNALNTNIGSWNVTGASELTVTTAAALGGGSVDVAEGSSFIYNAGDSETNESMGSALSGAGSFVKQGTNTLTMTGTVATDSVRVEGGSLAVGNALTTNSLTIGMGTTLALQDGAQLSTATVSNAGLIVVEGGASLSAGSAALNGQVEWTGGTLTLASTDQYAATTTTLTGNASYMILALAEATSATHVTYELGDLQLNGGLLTFSITGADTSSFSIENFTLSATSITGSTSVDNSIFLSLNGSIYSGNADAGTISFASIGDLPTDGTADHNTNYKLNTSATLQGVTNVHNLFLLPTNTDEGMTLTMDAANTLTVDGTLTVEGGAGAVNLAGGSATAQDVKLTSGNLVLQEGASLTVGNSLVSTGGKIQFAGGFFVYGDGFTGDISSMIAEGGDVKVTTAADVTWTTDVLANHAIEKSGAGCLTLDSVTLSSNVNINLVEGDLALNVSSNQTSTITADNKLTLSGGGQLEKTGTGTWQIVQEANLSEADSNAMSGNTFAGDILISKGTLLLGRANTDGIGSNLALSGNALGSKGTIKIDSGATLQLGMTQFATVNFTKDIILAGSSTVHAIDGNYELSGKLTLTGDATIRVDWDKSFNILNLIEGEGKLIVRHQNNTGTLILGAANAGDTGVTAFSGGIDVLDGNINVQFTHAQALGSGDVNLANNTNTLDYRGTAGAAYDTMSNVVSGNGRVTVTSGMLEMAGANTFTGATAVATDASLKVSGSIGSDASSNTYNVAKGAKLVLSGAGAVANSGVTVTTRSNTQAPLSDTASREVVEGELSNVTVTATGIARTSQDEVGTITNGAITVTQTEGFSIQNIELVNSLVDLQSTGSVTLDNVTIGAGTTVNRMEGAGNVTLNNSKLVMTTAQTTVGSLNNDTHTLSVTSTGLAGYTTISGSLTFDLTKEWIDNLVTNAGGNFTTIELTFSDVNADVWNDFKANGSPTLAQTGELNDSMFGPPTVTFGDTAGTVIIAATTNIPEPATATLGLLGLSILLLRRRRKVQD